jgi:hypothetical protein
MRSAFLSAHLDRLAESVLAQAERARAGAGHDDLKGSSIEVVVRRLLVQYLPTMVAVGTGQVANAMGSLSPQMDVLLHHGRVFPRLSVNEDGSVVVCCESVVAAVECKTRWDAGGIRDHLERFRAVGDRRSGWYEKHEDLAPAYFALCLDGPDGPSLEGFDDPRRAVGIYFLNRRKGWHSPYASAEFEAIEGNALEAFLGNVLQDAMRKGDPEIGTLERTYGAVARYFGWTLPANWPED